MKKLTIVVLLMMMWCQVQAAPYFRLMDPAHPQTSAGAFFDLKGHSDGGAILALITHAPADGCLIPAVCDGWAPLAIGGTMGQGLGGPSLAIGSSFNMLPITKAGLLALINAITNKSQFSNIKELLAPPALGLPDLAICIGPQYSLVIESLNRMKMVPTIFAGGTLKF
jgi:hypothetical protein